MAIGANPRLAEELMIGGGYANGGIDFEADGTIKTAGGLLLDGTIGPVGDADLMTPTADLLTVAGTLKSTNLAVGPLALPANNQAHIEAASTTGPGLQIHLATGQSGALWSALFIQSNENWASESGISFGTASIGTILGVDNPGIYLIRTSGNEADLRFYAYDNETRLLLLTLDGSANAVNIHQDLDLQGGTVQNSGGGIVYTVSTGEHAFEGGEVRINAAADPTFRTICSDTTIIENQVLGQWLAGGLDSDLDSARVVMKAAGVWGVGDTPSKVQIWTTPVGSGTIGLAAIFEADKSLTVVGGLTINDDFTIANGKNIVVNTATGTQIATAASQKLGFFGTTPVVQLPKASYNNWAALSDLVNALVAIGLLDAA